jgi:hypothetical protein
VAATNVKKGPTSQENWKASLVPGAELLGTYESEVYADVRIVGALEEPAALGPFSVINLVPTEPSPGLPVPALIFRVRWYLDDLTDYKTPGKDATDSSKYHGGTTDDELAALLSLSFGFRLQVGARVRVFDKEGDPLGRPQAERGRPRPSMTRRSEFGFLLRRVLEVPQLVPADHLRRFPDLDAEDAVAVVLAARLYQSALWIAEADPNSAWIMLVSALEVAAGVWAVEKYDSLGLFKEFEPELAAQLLEAGQAHLEAVANKYGRLSRAAKKFREFVLAFAPMPPANRPLPAFRVKWDKLGQICDGIYKWRSETLHAGTPFPLPVCMPPFNCPGGGLAEIPMGLASGFQDSWWEHNDSFVMLDTFEYIARTVLLNWWGSLAKPISLPPVSPGPL